MHLITHVSYSCYWSSYFPRKIAPLAKSESTLICEDESAHHLGSDCQVSQALNCLLSLQTHLTMHLPSQTNCKIAYKCLGCQLILEESKKQRLHTANKYICIIEPECYTSIGFSSSFPHSFHDPSYIATLSNPARFNAINP